PDLHAEFSRWNREVAMVSPVTPSELIPAIQQTMRDIIGHFSEVIAARRRSPAADMVSDLLLAEVDGQRLSDTEIRGFMLLVLLAGFETTSNLIAKSLLGLTERPTDLARLRASPELLGKFTDEALRHDAPVELVLRLTTSDATLSGT